jgi:hypothetical protein
MKREEITVPSLIKLIESGEKEKICLRSWQLAQLFGVYESAIRANVKAIIRAGIIIPCTGCEVRQVGNILLPESCNLEMIIALAFRLHSPDADKFRKYIIGRIINKKIVFGINYQLLN